MKTKTTAEVEMKATILTLSVLFLAACGGPVVDLPPAPAFVVDDEPEADAGPVDAGFWPILHCVETPDCGIGDICLLGRCEPDPRTLSCADEDCEPDCWWGQECASGYECVDVGSGDKCFEDDDCPVETCVDIGDDFVGVCNLSDRACQTDIDCAAVPCIDSACIVRAVCREVAS